MPTFLDSSNEMLNDTLAPKRKVIRNNIKTFSQDQFPNVGTTTDNKGAFDNLYGKLSNLLNSLTALANLLYVTFDAPNPSLTAKYNSAPLFADLNRTSLDLKNYVGKLTSLNNFEPAEVEQIKEILDLISVQDDAVGISVQEGKPNVQQVGQPLYERASGLYHIALSRLTAFVNAYSQVAPVSNFPTTTTSAVRELVGFGMYGGSIIPSISQTPSGSVFGSDGYLINRVAYSDPRRFY